MPPIVKELLSRDDKFAFNLDLKMYSKQYISAIRSEVGPEKIDHISNKTIYQILLWKGVMVGMKG